MDSFGSIFIIFDFFCSISFTNQWQIQKANNNNVINYDTSVEGELGIRTEPETSVDEGLKANKNPLSCGSSYIHFLERFLNAIICVLVKTFIIL